MSAVFKSFRFDFASATHPLRDRRELVLEVTADGEVNGVAQWIRLDIDFNNKDMTLEVRPIIKPPIFYAFTEPLRVSKGDQLRIATSYDETAVRNIFVGRRC